MANRELKMMPFQRIITVEGMFSEMLLGSSPSTEDLLHETTLKNAPDAPSKEEEIAALGIDEVERKGITVFSRDEDGNPHQWDYQWKGYFKSCCAALSRVSNTESSKVRAYKKIIDGLIFVSPRKVFLKLPENGEIGKLSRSLRAETAQGPRVAIATSETVPEGTTFKFSVLFPKQEEDESGTIGGGTISGAKKPAKPKKSKYEFSIEKCIREWLNYGCQHGTGQWRNAGFGRFDYVDVAEEVVPPATI